MFQLIRGGVTEIRADGQVGALLLCLSGNWGAGSEMEVAGRAGLCETDVGGGGAGG